MASSTASVIGADEIVARANRVIATDQRAEFLIATYVYVSAWFLVAGLVAIGRGAAPRAARRSGRPPGCAAADAAFLALGFILVSRINRRERRCPRPSRCRALALTLALAGCGGGKEERAGRSLPAGRRAGAGSSPGRCVRQPVGTGLFEVLPVEGKARRSGRVGKLGFGDYTFRARGEAEGGGLNGPARARGRRRSRASSGIGFLDAFAVSYRKDGQAMAGHGARSGKPTPGTRLATTGQARYRGPVRLDAAGPPAGRARRGDGAGRHRRAPRSASARGR